MQNIINKVKEIAFAFDKEQFPGRALHLSFLIYKKHIIAIGQNSKKTHPINLKNKKITKDGTDISKFRGTCSEWNALNKLKRLTNIPAERCILINIRINKQNKIRNSRPCCSCLSLLSFFGVPLIYYSNENGKFQKL